MFLCDRDDGIGRPLRYMRNRSAEYAETYLASSDLGHEEQMSRCPSFTGFTRASIA